MGDAVTSLKLTIDTRQVKSAVGNATLAVSNVPAQIVGPEMDQARRDLVEPYPAERPGQRYMRTGKRGAATKVTMTRGSNQYKATATLTSNPRYARGNTANPYVLGDEQGQGQAAVHVGRWKLMYTAVKDSVGRIVEKGNQYFRSVLERNGSP